MTHELALTHLDGSDHWTATCTCGWTSTYRLEDIPVRVEGDLQTLAIAELRLRHESHLSKLPLEVDYDQT